MSDIFGEQKLIHKATYWPPVGSNKFGQPKYGTAIEICCRWDDEIRQVIAPDGRTLSSMAVITADRDLKEGGALLHSELEDVTDLLIPFNNDHAWEIQLFLKESTVRGGQYLREAFVGQRVTIGG